MVFTGDLTLKGAQYEIAKNWCAAYKKWINGEGCEEQQPRGEAQMRVLLGRGSTRGLSS
jgi:hypothetical protein